MCCRMSPWKRMPIALMGPSTPERTTRRSVVLSASKRWLMVTAILRPAVATLCAMRSDAAIVSAIGFSHRTSIPRASARSMMRS